MLNMDAAVAVGRMFLEMLPAETHWDLKMSCWIKAEGGIPVVVETVESQDSQHVVALVDEDQALKLEVTVVLEVVSLLVWVQI